jgi:prevent-host-death family protein
MDEIAITSARQRWRELVDRAAKGESFTITRRGKPLALLTPVRPPRKAVDIVALKALTDGMPMEEQSAGEFVRRMRDGDRY